MKNHLKYSLICFLVIYFGYKIPKATAQEKDYFNLCLNSPEAVNDTLYKLQKNYRAHQNRNRKRVSPDGKSTGWDIINYNYNLTLNKDSTFILEKSHNNYSTEEFGNWYHDGNYLLLNFAGSKIGTKKTFYDSTHIEKFLIQSDNTLFDEKDRLLFTSN